jgi:hypothetical protein
LRQLTAADIDAIKRLFDACAGSVSCTHGSTLDIAMLRVEKIIWPEVDGAIWPKSHYAALGESSAADEAKPSTCPTCHGSGKVDITHSPLRDGYTETVRECCDSCGGAGKDEPVVDGLHTMYVWHAHTKGDENDRFIRAWTSDPARVPSLQATIGESPAVYRTAQSGPHAPYQYGSDPVNAIRGALDWGYQGVHTPPEGHWLTEFWQYGRRQAELEQANQQKAAPTGFAIKHVEGHGWIIDPPSGGRWIAHENTPAGDFFAAMLAAAPKGAAR